MKTDENRRDVMIDYIWKISDKRVNTSRLLNEKEYGFRDLRAVAFRWFCIKHKIKLLDLIDLLDKTKYSSSHSSIKLGITKKELKDSGKKI